MTSTRSSGRADAQCRGAAGAAAHTSRSDDHAHTRKFRAASLFVDRHFLPPFLATPDVQLVHDGRRWCALGFYAKAAAIPCPLRSLRSTAANSSASSTSLRACMNLALGVWPKLTHALISNRPTAHPGRFQFMAESLPRALPAIQRRHLTCTRNTP